MCNTSQNSCSTLWIELTLGAHSLDRQLYVVCIYVETFRLEAFNKAGSQCQWLQFVYIHESYLAFAHVDTTTTQSLLLNICCSEVVLPLVLCEPLL